MKKKYPNSVYTGIHSDPETWGMCCSEEAAQKCAEEYYDIYERKDHFWSVFFGVQLFIMKWIGICFLCGCTMLVIYDTFNMSPIVLVCALPVFAMILLFYEIGYRKAKKNYQKHGLYEPYCSWKVYVTIARGYFGATAFAVVALLLNGML